MVNLFTPFEHRKLTAKNKALLNEWKEIDELCILRQDISYNIIKKNKDDLPIIYDIIYKIPSLIDLDQEKNVNPKSLPDKTIDEKLMFYPLFGNVHRLQISIPEKFPQISGKPRGVITTKIWHPNIICHGDDNIVGRVCFNEGNLDAGVTIVDRILQVADYLSYKNYLAEDREPYPYDMDVAHWVRDIAEPLGWIIPERGLNYEKFGIKIELPSKTEPEKQKDTLPDTDILIIEDEDDNYEFPMDIIENEIDSKKNGDDEIFEL